jgi:hypothetical protein
MVLLLPLPPWIGQSVYNKRCSSGWDYIRTMSWFCPAFIWIPRAYPPERGTSCWNLTNVWSERPPGSNLPPPRPKPTSRQIWPDPILHPGWPQPYTLVTREDWTYTLVNPILKWPDVIWPEPTRPNLTPRPTWPNQTQPEPTPRPDPKLGLPYSPGHCQVAQLVSTIYEVILNLSRANINTFNHFHYH